MLKILSSATLLLASFVTHADIKDAPLDFTQPPSIYNADYVDIVGEETREHEDLKREYSLAIEPKYKSKRNRMASQLQMLSKTASQVEMETGCPNLAIGSGTLVAFNTEGSSYCVSTVVDAETKIEGLMLNIPSAVNYDLFFFKYEDDGQFTLIDSSVSPNSTSEQTVAKAAAGAYVLFAQATQGSSGDPVTLGWLGYNNFDQYEANDKFGQSTSLQTNAVIQGNLDNANDLDFFSYTVGPDQSLLSLRFSASEQFSFEIWNGAAWVQLVKNQLNTYNVTPGPRLTSWFGLRQVIHLRHRPNTLWVFIIQAQLRVSQALKPGIMKT
ncbi:hypothetical protein SAMN02745127_00207 [Oceanospirillum multiglobuliferum]|uniref:Peptidase C-terminal archaeal/bacterial domain-containing protein n=1 Tax=Oceanospirillum multiglobuliferum TaxID=64969 RepID=A0A1T4KTA7_9GAMM|nr:hypothetical protein [Oceanospirillum multiglobuliferum]OPX54931.1 hypothetical protein BTE48_11345 [Oceanospirillum multiglobuliferum]SJZ45590.1 hypothetical protein SAMN02745127_00207 [Oceanospirillum multiglobuliferum]